MDGLFYCVVDDSFDRILEKVEFIEKRSPETVNVYKNRIEQKVKELLEDTTIDEQRILTEVAIFADKVAVDEETVIVEDKDNGELTKVVKLETAELSDLHCCSSFSIRFLRSLRSPLKLSSAALTAVS